MATPTTLDEFRKRLKAGHYGSLTGARRAIGKSLNMTAAEKEKAQKSANEKFKTKKSK